MVQTGKRLFTVDEYYRMAEAGILQEDEHVELLEGEIVEMVPTGSHHAGIVGRLNWLLSPLVNPLDAIVFVQNPVRLTDRSEPEPDIAVLSARPDFYTESHPEPPDVLLLIEVADSSAGSDRRRKLPLYAKNGIREVWIVDLNEKRVEVYREPSTNAFKTMHLAEPGDSVTIEALPSVSLGVDDILVGKGR